MVEVDRPLRTIEYGAEKRLFACRITKTIV